MCGYYCFFARPPPCGGGSRRSSTISNGNMQVDLIIRSPPLLRLFLMIFLCSMSSFDREAKILNFVHASTTTIHAHDLKQGGDGIPTLGRGYTVATNAFHSNCLEVGKDIILDPAIYNYDCKYSKI